MVLAVAALFIEHAAHIYATERCHSGLKGHFPRSYPGGAPGSVGYRYLFQRSPSAIWIFLKICALHWPPIGLNRYLLLSKCASGRKN
jgi:hypothetical protein